MSHDIKNRYSRIRTLIVCTPILLVIINLSVACRTKSNYYSNPGFGLDANEYVRQKKELFENLHDLILHSNDNVRKYENKLGYIEIINTDSIPRKRVIIKDFKDVRFLYFLGYLSDIDIKVGDWYNTHNSPSLDALREFDAFYSTRRKLNVYPYWLYFNVDNLFLETVFNDFNLELTLESDDSEEIIMQKYIEKYPNRQYSKNLLLFDGLKQHSDLLRGILKSEPDTTLLYGPRWIKKPKSKK